MSCVIFIIISNNHLVDYLNPDKNQYEVGRLDNGVDYSFNFYQGVDAQSLENLL